MKVRLFLASRSEYDCVSLESYKSRLFRANDQMLMDEATMCVPSWQQTFLGKSDQQRKPSDYVKQPLDVNKASALVERST